MIPRCSGWPSRWKVTSRTVDNACIARRRQINTRLFEPSAQESLDQQGQRRDENGVYSKDSGLGL